MNKKQYITLLEIRGVTELNGKTIAEAIRVSGGDPSDSEMNQVNEKIIHEYINKIQELEETNKSLSEKLYKLGNENVRLNSWKFALEAAGVDNWEGYDIAMDMLEKEPLVITRDVKPMTSIT